MNGSEATDFHGRLLGLRFEVMYKSVFFCDGGLDQATDAGSSLQNPKPPAHV